MSAYRWPRPYIPCCPAGCKGTPPSYCKRPKEITWKKVEGGNLPLVKP